MAKAEGARAQNRLDLDMGAAATVLHLLMLCRFG